MPKATEIITDNENTSDSSNNRETSKAKPSVFQTKWLSEWPWLAQNDKGAMVCKFCIDNRMSNAFTTGCENYRTSTLYRHAETTHHKLSVVAKSQSKRLEQTVCNAISQQERAITAAIDTVYWLAKENIATEKYPSLLELLEKEGCSDIKNWNTAKNACYHSRTIAEEIQQALADTLMTLNV